MKKVLIITNIPSPYRVEFFNQLGKKCDLTVLFEKRQSDERDESWNNYKFEFFKGIFLHGKSIAVDMAICLDVIKYVKDSSFDCIICMDFITPTGMLAIQYMKMHKIEYWLESDGGFAKSGRGIKEKIKKYFIKDAKGYFSTNKEHDNYYVRYGAEREKIVRYPFSSITKQDLEVEIKNLNENKEKKRKRLEITEDKIILSVGQFIHRKGFDLLLEVAKNLPKSVGIYIIGGKPTQEYLEIKEKYQLDNIHFLGFKLKKELGDYYDCADLFVFPTREDIWGLVINEAMAHALPVITTMKCGAGIELIQNEKNGYLIPADSLTALDKAIRNGLEDRFLINARLKSFETIQNYTIENMVEYHIKILKL